MVTDTNSLLISMLFLLFGYFGCAIQWNDALATLDPKAVAARYTKDAVLLPTVSGKYQYDQGHFFT
jgi:hypothetical protein